MTDAQIVEESFLEHVCILMTTGMPLTLLSKQEKDALLDTVADEVS